MSQQVREILEELPPYQGDQRMITRRQDTFDIIREILRKHKATMAHYDAICEQHWKGSPEETARGLYMFLKSHAPYRVEPTLKQTVKTPAAILSERHTFGNDCKHYASYIVGVGEALRRRGYPVKSFYRFASYTKGSKNPGHVFGVFVCDGKEFWIDPVPEIPGFNSRQVQPVFTTDRMPPMSKNGSRIGSLYDISGISNDDRISGHKAPHWLDQLHNLQHGHHQEPMHVQTAQRRPGMMRHAGQHTRPLERPFASSSGSSSTTSFVPAAVAPMSGYHGHHVHWLDQPKPHEHYDADINENLIGKAKKKKKGIHLKIKAPHLKIKAPKIKIPHIKIQPGKLLLKVSLAPARGSFLLLTEINMFDLAVKMWDKAAKDQNSAAWKKLTAEWTKLGGKSAALLKSIKKGVNTHNKLHKKNKVSGEIFDFYTAEMQPSYRIGIVAAAPAAIAAAAPIIAALTNLLKSFGINTKKAADDGDAATKKVAGKHNKHKDNTDDTGDTTHDDGTVTAAGTDENGDQAIHIKDVAGAADADSGAGPDEPTPGPTAGGGGGGNNMATGSDDSSGDDTPAAASKALVTTSGGDDDDNTPAPGESGFTAMLDKVKVFVGDHKVYFIGGAIVMAALIVFKIVHKPGKKRRR